MRITHRKWTVRMIDVGRSFRQIKYSTMKLRSKNLESYNFVECISIQRFQFAWIEANCGNTAKMCTKICLESLVFDCLITREKTSMHPVDWILFWIFRNRNDIDRQKVSGKKIYQSLWMSIRMFSYCANDFWFLITSMWFVHSETLWFLALKFNFHQFFAGKTIILSKYFHWNMR